MQLFDDEIGDMMLLEALERHIPRLWPGLQGGIQNFLFHQLVSVQVGGEGRQQLAASGLRSLGGFFSLLQERFEVTMLPLEYFDGVGLRRAARDFAGYRGDDAGESAP